MTNSARYLGLVIAAFPQLRETLASEEGIYLKTHSFVDFANSAISRGDWSTLGKCYELVDRVLREDPDDEVYNAIYVSFIEHLDFYSDPEKGGNAKKMLTPRLLAAWKELEEHWRKRSEQNRTQKQ